MQALKADPQIEAEQAEQAEVQEAVGSEEATVTPEAEGPRAPTIDEFERWWTRSEELESILRRLPRDVVSAASMGNRREQLLERWEDLETPALDEEVDEDMYGELMSWIRDSETLIHYIIYTRDVRGDDATAGAESASNDTTTSTTSAEEPVVAEAPPAASVSTQSSLRVIGSIDDAPGVSMDWKWPWIQGWDDLDRRKKILNPKSKKGKKMSLKRAATYSAIGAGAVFMISRYIDE